jgi:predicted permease
MLARQPGFSAVAVVVLALGIGANSAVFSLVNALLFKPRPGDPGGALVQVFSHDGTKPDSYRAFSYPNFEDLRERRDLFASLSAHTFALAGLEDHGRTRRVFIDVTSANFFETFGVPLLAGRPFTLGEERPGARQPVAILSYPAAERLGGAARVLGETLRLNGQPITVIGVAPRGFGGSFALATPELWLPLGMYEAVVNDFALEGLASTLGDRRHHALVLVGRLPAGRNREALAPALEVASHSLAVAYPAENHDQILSVDQLSRLSVSNSPGHDGALSTLAGALITLSVLVLLIASFNVANMLLARGANRRREFAIRAAIGGGRVRLVRQLLVEGFVLALASGALGLLLSTWATSTLVSAVSALSPVALSFDVAPDLRATLVVIAVCGAATMLFGLGPAIGLARTDVLTGLRARVSDLGSGRRRLRLQHLLVMAQLALSLVLLTLGGIFLRSARTAAHLDPGFTFDRGVMIHADAALGGVPADRMPLLYGRILDDLRTRPDVTAASLASLVPFGDIDQRLGLQRPGPPLAKGDVGLVDTVYTSIGARYFETLGLRLTAGRDFTATEERSGGGEAIAIIDAPLAARLFGHRDPVGALVEYSPGPDLSPVVLRVVGLVPGTKQDLFDTAPVPHLYVPFGAAPKADVYFHIATAAPTLAAETTLVASLRETVERADRRLPVLAAETRPAYRDDNLLFGLVRIGASLFTVFAAVALVLAVVGVYGVKAYVVSSRTRELGIRIALGASSRAVVWAVVRDGFALALLGLTIGMGLSALASAGMRAMTVQTSPVDLPTVLGPTAILAAAAVLASWIPARRATAVPPTVALRAD